MTVEHDDTTDDTNTGAQDTGSEPEAGSAAEDSQPERSGLDALNEALGEGGEGDDDGGSSETQEAPAGDEAGEAAAAGNEAADGEAGDRSGADPQGEGEPAKPDYVNDPIPPQLKGRTRERMEGLVKEVKARDDQIQQALAQRDELVDTIRSTGATPEQFGRTLETLKLLNSANVEDKKRGLAMLREDVGTIATVLGEDIGDPKLLERHEDLQQAVEYGEITEKHARELAMRREAEQRTREAHTQRSQLTEQQQREHQAGTDALNALGRELQADPDYAKKAPIVIAALRPKFQSGEIPPSQWAMKFAAEYAKTRVPAAPAAGQQPLRGRQPAGGSTEARRQPKTGLEAVNFALEELANRRQR